MAGTQEKIQLLLRIAHRLNEAHVEWALGASMLLYFKGITSEFHDIPYLHKSRFLFYLLPDIQELAYFFLSLK